MFDHYAILQYRGADFAGWQRQVNTRTVQGEFEAALARLAGGPVTAHAAGRTDAGVHALGQVSSFLLPRKWDPQDLPRALNAWTPEDIWISEARPAPAGFHARKHAQSRVYRYVIGCDRAAWSPFRRPFEWALGRPLDEGLLRQSATLFTGEHQFRSFSAVGQEKPHYRCIIREATWTRRTDGEGFIFTVDANRFLHRMVRFLVGMMVDVAGGQRPIDDIARLLERENNQEASPPAPPQGLYFLRATYPQLEPGSQV